MTPKMDVDAIRKEVDRFLDFPFLGSIQFVKDSSDYIKITRGDVLQFNGESYFVLGNMYESRFSLEEYPKHWVKSAISLSSLTKKILKWEFDEDFTITIGFLTIKCYRSSQKESDILKLTQNHPRFMKGQTVQDSKGKLVRILDFIEGKDLYRYLQDLALPHERYFHTVFPTILQQLVDCFDAIAYLHSHSYYHGDIRNDHIIIDNMSTNFNSFKWIDFDLNQDYSDFDVWSLGNILLFSAGKTEHTFYNISKNKEIPEKYCHHVNSDDASAFFKHRIINLRKIFPYIPEKFNSILMHFSINTQVFYDTVKQITDDIHEVLECM